MRYGIVGAGRQGAAAAYDLAVRGGASEIVLADVDPERSNATAGLVADLVPGVPVRGVQLNALDGDAVRSFLEPLDCALGAASWRLNVALTDAAIDVGTHWADLGGNADVVWAQFERDEQARGAGVGVVPDTGQVPGTGANVMAIVARRFDVAESVVLYDGGIPQHPTPPWNYELTFNMDGLTNEYDGDALYIVDGKQKPVPTFDPSEYETVKLERFGTLEAFAAAGGLTTLSQTLDGKINTLKNKTLRYPGHAAQWAAFRDAGFFGEDPVEVNDVEVIPRGVFHALIEPKIQASDEYEDVVINRGVGTGEIDGEKKKLTLDVITWPPEDLPFTAMQAATGWHAAIICERLASGEVGPGVIEVENAVGEELLDAFRDRGFEVNESWETLEE